MCCLHMTTSAGKNLPVPAGFIHILPQETGNALTQEKTRFDHALDSMGLLLLLLSRFSSVRLYETP